MIRLRIVTATVLSVMAVMPAAAADLSGYRGYYVKAPQPYYVVNQGPMFSGPGITVTYIGLTWTGVKRAYPFVRPYPHVRRVHY